MNRLVFYPFVLLCALLAPVSISAFGCPFSELSRTTITLDLLGRVLPTTRSGNSDTATRSYLYDTEQRLCQLTEPESDALVMSYDLSGNLDWSAEGRVSANDCATARTNVPAINKIQRAYEKRNWLNSIDYPATAGLPSADAQNTYFADGQLKTLSSGGSGWTYIYNSLRKINSETLNFQNRNFLIDWNYDSQGAINSIIYPNSETTAFTPNALGQSTQVGSLISATRWHPSRTNASWTFGNGIQRALTQTSRKLPDRLTDSGSGSAVIFDEDLKYDENGNVTAITDTRDPTLNRTLSYDAQDRLTQAQGVWGSGSMTYDGADNLKTQTIGAKNYTYTYTNQKLQTISNPTQTLFSLGDDAKGNQTQKNGQSLTLDKASRIARADGKAQYRYDGHGRRLLVEKLDVNNQPTGNLTLQIYSQAGKLFYEEAITSSTAGADVIFDNGFEQNGTTYHYLDKTLVARTDAQNTITPTTYSHTKLPG